MHHTPLLFYMTKPDFYMTKPDMVLSLMQYQFQCQC